MTGPELQTRIVRQVEAHYDAVVAAHRRAGLDAAEAHRLALTEAVRLLGDLLDEARSRGWFPFPAGEIPSLRRTAGGRHA